MYSLRSILKLIINPCTPCHLLFFFFLPIDVDECSNNQHNCDHVCGNIVGSFNCSCQNGFILQPDGRTCEGMIMCKTCHFHNTYTYDFSQIISIYLCFT